MVIRTFCQPEESEPVDTQRLTLSSAPFVIQGQASPLTRRAKRHLLHLCHQEATRPMTCGGTLWLSASLVIQRRQVR